MFTHPELDYALEKAMDTAPGPDGIHYQMIKHLSPDAKEYLLSMYNRIWTEGMIPRDWKEATVLPILKLCKDPTDSSSYRPIALTSCLCKVLERMVNTRLVWQLESSGILAPSQCGFRRNRSAVDHLVVLESAIREAFAKKQHLVAVFFDLEKAYDTTWRYGILRNLASYGFRGRLPLFLVNFLSERTFRVRVGSCLSDRQVQEAGVPQGGVLSVTLFAIAINGIAQSVSLPNSMFVDDFALWA